MTFSLDVIDPSNEFFTVVISSASLLKSIASIVDLTFVIMTDSPNNGISDCKMNGRISNHNLFKM